VLTFAFLARATWNILSVGIFQFFKLASDPCLTIHEQIMVFCLYTFWEIIPAAMVLIVFWRIPDPHKLKIKKPPPNFQNSHIKYSPFTGMISNSSSINTASLLSINNDTTDAEQQSLHTSLPSVTSAAVNLFNNPSRYDSEEETHPTVNNNRSGPPSKASRKITSYSIRSPLLQSPKGSPFDD